MQDSGQMPQFVNVRYNNGRIEKIPYKVLKDHEESIIEENIAYGAIHGYSDKEISEYEREARAEWKELKRQIRENNNVLLCLDETTQRYIVYTTGAQIIPFPNANI